MKPVRLFGFLCLGYVGIWITVSISIASNLVGDGRGFLDAFLSSLFMSLVFLYPPSALSYLFYKQLDITRWLYSFRFSTLCGFAFFVWIFIDRLGGGGTGYDGFKYLLGLPFAYILTISIVGFACISKKQKLLTRKLGIISLATLLYWPTYIFVLHAWIQANYPDLNTFELFVFVPFWLHCAIAFSALSSAVFLGLKQEQVAS